MTPARLTPEDLADSSKLGALTDVVVNDGNYRKVTTKILAAHSRLQQLAETDAWVAYLDIESLVNERTHIMLMSVARWAFHEGRRHQRQHRRRE